jgi:hypothetical protein
MEAGRQPAITTQADIATAVTNDRHGARLAFQSADEPSAGSQRRRTLPSMRLATCIIQFGLPGFRTGVRAGSAAVSSAGAWLEIISSMCCMVCLSAMISGPGGRHDDEGLYRMDTGARLFACLSSRA